MVCFLYDNPPSIFLLHWVEFQGCQKIYMNVHGYYLAYLDSLLVKKKAQYSINHQHTLVFSYLLQGSPYLPPPRL